MMRHEFYLNKDEFQGIYSGDRKIKIKTCDQREKQVAPGDELCFICNDDSRNRDILCVVEDTKNVFLFERLGMYHGMYHVLDGLINPLEGINPEDIGLDQLIERIHKEKFQEIIFAFKPSIEGETTALYIKKILEDMDITITRLASGVPIGADMEYVDSLTLERALNDRKEIE